VNVAVYLSHLWDAVGAMGMGKFHETQSGQAVCTCTPKKSEKGSMWINPEFAGAFGATNSEKNASTIESDRDSEDGSRVKMLKDAQGLILVIT